MERGAAIDRITIVASRRLAALAALLLVLGACRRHEEHTVASEILAPAAAGTRDAENVLNVYSWIDYIAPDTVANFEKETGIKVRYDTYDNICGRPPDSATTQSRCARGWAPLSRTAGR